MPQLPLHGAAVYVSGIGPPACVAARDLQQLGVPISQLNVQEWGMQVWGLLDQRFQPLADRLPLLRTPVGFAQRWFNNGR